MTGMQDPDLLSALRCRKQALSEHLYRKYNDRRFYLCYSWFREKTGLYVRKGKAMLQIHMNSLMNTYRPYDLQGIIMPSADKAERLNKTCLKMTGSSGYLGPGASKRMLG